MCVTKNIKILLFVSLLWASPVGLTGSSGNSFSLDIDNDGSTQALTDGLLVLRYLFGFQGTSLVENAVSDGATRTTAAEIEAYLGTNEALLDLDGNDRIDSLTDGLLLLRYLFGFSGQSLIEASLATDAERTSSGEVESYVYRYLDSDGDGVTNPNDAFPLNAQETSDSDGDGIGNNADSFPTNPGETTDTDGDGFGDNGDAFPLNELEWMDADGDGVGDNADAFPANAREWRDTDADGIGDNSDLFPNNATESADYDADGVGDNSDAFPFDGSESRDTDADGIGDNADSDDDGDGVADELDVASDNASISKALSVNLDQVASIGLGNGLESSTDPQGIGVELLAKLFKAGLGELFEFDVKRDRFGKVLRSDNVTNLLGFDEAGSALEGILSSDKTTFVAEANVSPDRKYLYLLTSAHIQARTPGLVDKEDCSIYRIKISDGSFVCLLLTDDGDIEPATLTFSILNDHSRRAMDFRADGAAVMVGFDWNRVLPEGVSGGTNNTMAWILGRTGTLSSIPIQGNYYASSTAWLDDDSIYVFQKAFNSGGLDPPARIVIHHADTLAVEKIIAHGYDEVTWEPEYFYVSQLTKYDGDLYDGAYVLDPETRTLAKSDSIFGGVAVTNHTGKKQFDFDFTPHMPDLDVEVNAVWGACEYEHDYRRTLTEVSTAADKITPMILNDCGTGLNSYATYRQSETTDVKYQPFFFTDDYILYRRVFLSKSTVVSIEGISYDYQTLLENGEAFSQELSDDKGSLYVDGSDVSGAPSRWRYWPSDSVVSTAAQSVADGESGTGVTISLEVQTDGTTQTIEWLIPYKLINFLLTTGGEDHVQYVPPFTHREGFCIYEIATSSVRCSELDGYDVRVADAGNFSNPITKEANRNAGVQTQLIVGPNVLVYFKDSTQDQYYVGVANVEEFLRDGDSALTITESEEDDGAIKLIEQALALSMDSFRSNEQVSMRRIADSGEYANLSLDLGQGLSQRVVLPEALLVDASNNAEISIDKSVWDTSLRTAVLRIDKSRLATTTYRVQFRGGYFYRNDALRYQIPTSVEFIYDPDDFDVDGSTDDVDQDDDNDGTDDADDAFPLDPLEVLDTDSDGVGNNADTDDDNDGTLDEADAFPLDDAESLDSDGDGIGNNADADPYVADVYVIEFAAGNVVVWENGEVARIPVHRIYDTGSSISVNYTTSNINALAGRDYTTTSGTLTWADGEKSVQYIEVPIIDNAETGDGTYQQFAVELADLSGRNAFLGKATTLVTIVEDDLVDIPENFVGVVTPMYFDTRVAEDAGSIVLSFSRRLGSYGEYSLQLSIDTVSNILNVGMDSDELPTMATDTLTWADGEVGVKSISLKIPDDSSSEWTKSYRVFAPPEINMLDSIGFVLDNEIDRSQGSLVPLDHYVRAAEKAKRLEFGVMRVGGRDGARTISVATKSGVFGSREVEEGADYVAASETMNWRDGELGPKSMAITLVDDQIDEGTTEWLAVLVDGGYTAANSNPQMKPDTYLGLIFDDDPSIADSDADGYADVVDADDDNDGTADPYDRFPYDPSESKDSDSDGIGDNADVFPLISIDGRADTDSDGAPNSCNEACLSVGMAADEDDDGDGVDDVDDAFPLISLDGATDTDADGAPNSCDTECQNKGMTADADDDGDGVVDTDDAFPLISIGGRTDTDGDGAPDTCDDECLATDMTADSDDDNDGVADDEDEFPLDPTASAAATDTDGDGLPDSASEKFISKGSIWRYLDDGSDQETAWRATDFDDTAWASGAAQLGYGDGDEATTVSSGSSESKHLTTYFRHQFDVADSSVVETLTLKLLRDDGAIVYLNNVEVVRSNMPAGTVGFDTVASDVISGDDESSYTSFAVEVAVLVSGKNVIAVEIHQAGVESSDVSFDLEFSANGDDDDDNDGVPDENDAFPLDSSETTDSDGDGIGDNADGDTIITAPAGVIEFAVDHTVVFENESSVRIPLHRLYDDTNDATVNYSTADQNAFASQDYEATSGTLEWEAGDKPSQKKYIEVPILDNDDRSDGTYRRFVVELDQLTGSNTLIGKAKTLVTIVDDEFADVPDDFVGLLSRVYYGIRVEEGSGSIPFAFARRLGSTGEMKVNLNVYPKSGFLSEAMDEDELPTISVSTGTPLVAKGSTWRYLDDGSDQGTDWFASDFDDSTWTLGVAQLGYGDGDESTTISSGSSENKNITTYFRHQFNVDDVSSVEKLTINLLRDDGAVVYLNGVEVVRSNMPSGAIGFDTAAPQSVAGSEEARFWSFNVEPTHLASGGNVLAVEIHQASGSSSDSSFDLELIANEGDDSLTWEDGESGVKYFNLDVPDDSESEGIEMFYVNATFGDFSTGNTGHVLDNDLTNGGVLVPLHGYVNGSEQSQVLEFGVMRVGGGSQGRSINIETKTGIFNPTSEATVADDYDALSETLTWADGEIGAKSVSIPIVDDAIAEAREFIAIMIDGGFESSSTNPQLKPDTYLGLVLDNDASTADFDEDGYVDAIDADDDNDGVIDSYDAFSKNGSETKDSDGDGIGDNEDDDDDGDGVPDQSDAYPLDPGKT